MTTRFLTAALHACVVMLLSSYWQCKSSCE